MTIAPVLSASEETLQNADGQQLFIRIWRPASTSKAVLVICPGFNAHSGLYERAARQFVEDGLAVYALDLRGRGRSEGERFYVESVDDYVGDLAAAVALAKAGNPGLPVYSWGIAPAVSSPVFTHSPIRPRSPA